jgi:hypothetical protein
MITKVDLFVRETPRPVLSQAGQGRLWLVQDSFWKQPSGRSNRSYECQ